jgi:hypothetical protein
MNILFTNEEVIGGGRAGHGRARPISVSSRRLATTSITCALFAFAACPADAAAPFAQLDGSWSGSGRINLTDGKSEGLKCRAYYTPKESGAEIGVALRCASASNKVELRAKLTCEGSRVWGSWEERTFNASGTVTGLASSTQIKLAINGGGFAGSMAVTTTGKSQIISVSTEGVALKGISIKLQRD